MGLVEATLWLRLGIEIGFFDEESVADDLLPSMGDGLSAAWSVLIEANALSSGTWCDFMSDGPKPTFMKDKFFGPLQKKVRTFDNLSDPEHLAYLLQCFLGFLLLTSEVIFEPSTMIFLQSIGWDTDDKWAHLIRGDSMSLEFHVAEFNIGFANHVQYLEQLRKYRADNVLFVSDRLDSINSILALDQKVGKIVSQRVILDRPHVKGRCFKLGSWILSIVNQPGPEWQEVRRSIFSQIARITESNKNDRPRLWSDFINNTREDIDRAERELRRDFLKGPSLAME